MKYYLYNPLSNNGIRPEFKEGSNVVEVIGLNYQEFFSNLKKDDEVVLVGGDGTINYFINEVDTDNLKNNIYIKNLPTVEVNGMKRKFINGIGYGIDGYCCEVADKMKETEPNKKINYTSIAIKGLLFHFKPKGATITVDGETHEFKHVWLAPSMKGRFYGGGMMVAPNQNRLEEKLSVVVYMTRSKLKALMVFPSIFKGEHIKKDKMVKVFEGKEIEVKFNVPCALQIDGETVLNVSSYKVHL